MSQPSATEFETMYEGGTVPWDIGRPQPMLVAAADAGQIRGDVLDVGCGPGDNAIFLASQGYRVTAIDGAPTAIEMARERAKAKGVEVDFVIGDAIELAGYEDRFDTVVDWGLYHCLTEQQRHSYLAALHQAARPGAQLQLFCFSDLLPAAFPDSFRLGEQYLRRALRPQWSITNLVRTMSDTSMPGSVQLPVWHLTAERVG